MFDVIVVGGGPAGVTAALRSRELGANVALFERGDLGGVCTNDGCVPTRVLAKAARLIRDSEHFDEYGLVINPPKFNFSSLIERTHTIINAIHEKKQLEDHLAEVGIQVYTKVGDVRFADDHTIMMEDGSQWSAEKIILCAGGHSRMFPFPGAEYAITYRDIWSMKELPKSIAVVGGAATGCQIASIFAAFGVQVFLIEAGQTLLRVEDALVSRVMKDLFERRGIKVITGISGIERIDRTNNGLLLSITLGNTTETLNVESIIMSVGWVANSDTLNLSATPVKTERGFIVVNDYLQTTAPHIYAAGDITGRMMLVQSGSYEGRIAAENAVLGPGQPYIHQIVPHGGFTDPEYASVGLTEENACTNDCAVAVVPYADLDRAVIDNLTEGFCKLIVSRETHRILGAHVVGEQAVEIVQLAATAMAADMWVEQLAELELAYPTYTTIIGLAARKLLKELGVMPLAPQWNSLGKPHLAEWERGQYQQGDP